MGKGQYICSKGYIKNDPCLWPQMEREMSWHWMLAFQKNFLQMGGDQNCLTSYVFYVSGRMAKKVSKLENSLSPFFFSQNSLGQFMTCYLY